MDKKYIELFKQLAQATAASAETVMDYDRENGDEKGLAAATTMRDDFQALADSLTDDYQTNKADVARLLVGATIQVAQLQDRITNLTKAITGYKADVIPKLQEVLDNAKDDEEAVKLANEKFIIENNE